MKYIIASACMLSFLTGFGLAGWLFIGQVQLVDVILFVVMWVAIAAYLAVGVWANGQGEEEAAGE